MNKIFGIIGIGFLYLALMLFFSINSSNLQASNNFILDVFADITFDSQDSDKWYNSSNSEAIADVSPNATPAPVKITVVTRHSH